MIDIEKFYTDNRRTYISRLNKWIGQSSSEDCWQEAITRVMERWELFSEYDEEQFESKFYGVLRNCVRDERNALRGTYYESIDEFQHPCEDINIHKPTMYNEVAFAVEKLEDPLVKKFAGSFCSKATPSSR